MKKIYSIILSGICIFSVSSCKKYLDINNNPNQATSSTPELVLPQALTSTAALMSGNSQNVGSSGGDNYNTYGSQLVGYVGNAGGYGSLGVLISYAFTTGDFPGLFQNTYDNLSDYQYIIDQTEGKPEYQVFNAVANVMRAYDYQMLVDTYNDVPYTDALKGTSVLQPKYDKAEDIYKDLGSKLDAAIAVLNTVESTAAFDKADIMFQGHVEQWAQFANTLKLRLIIRAGSKVAFAKPTPDATAGFLTDDAIVNPGYTKIANKQNPFWDYYVADATGTVPGRAGVILASPWILGFYDGTKIVDDNRGGVVFNAYNGSATTHNQLGYTGQDAARPAIPNAWFQGGTDPADYAGYGIFKGPSAGQPLMLAAESEFLQAEALVRGIGSVSGSAKEHFDAGILASFTYLYKDETGGLAGDPAPDVATYHADNTDRYLVRYDTFTIHNQDGTTTTRATTDSEKLEAIITQKYIAFNMLFGGEAWNEYRRTGYPKITGNTPTTTFASTVSQATAVDKLPTRILYPGSEYTYNSNNVPKDVSPYTSKIFWAK